MSDKLLALQDAPAEAWYSQMTKAQENKVANMGGQLVSSALNRRIKAATLRQKVAALPHAIINYSEDQLKRYGGLVPEVEEIAVLAADLGIGRDDICKMIGVRRQLFINWLEKGLNGEFPFNVLSQRLMQAEAFADLEDENDLREAIALESKAAAPAIVLMKRRDERRQIENDQLNTIPPEILQQLTDEEFSEYQQTGAIPLRFRGGSTVTKPYVDGQLVGEEEDLSFIKIYRLEMEIRALREQQIRNYSEPEVIDVEEDPEA